VFLPISKDDISRLTVNRSTPNQGGRGILEIREHEIYRYLLGNGEKMRIADACKALGKDEETRKTVKERLAMMARFGILDINGDYVSIKMKKK
jgi:predicted DNA-binding transcriptional regulator